MLWLSEVCRLLVEAVDHEIKKRRTVGVWYGKRGISKGA